MDQLAQTLLKILAFLGWLGRSIVGLLWNVGQHSTKPASAKRRYPDPLKLVGGATVTLIVLAATWFLTIPSTMVFLIGFGCGAYIMHTIYRPD